MVRSIKTLAILGLLGLFLLNSCSENIEKKLEVPAENDSQKPARPVSNDVSIENIVQEFCKVSNEKDPKALTDLVYPKLFSKELDKSSFEYLFFRNFNAMDKFERTDIQMESAPKEVFSFQGDKFYSQKYLSKTFMKINIAAISGFEQIAAQTKSKDKDAEIDYENYTLNFKDKSRILIVSNDEGTYVMPEIFLDYLKVEGLDVSKLKEAYSNAN